jgi:hypothetical protein
MEVDVMLAFFRDLKPWGQVGVVIGLLGALVGAIAAIIASPVFGIVFTLIMVAVFYIAFKFALGPYAKQRALAKSGKQAEGTILGVEDTGVTVNEIYPLIKVRLEVRPPGGQPYEAETKMLINRMEIPQIQPGLVVPVLYDPDDPDTVTIGVIEGQQAALGAGAEDPERLRMAEEFLTKEDKKNEEIRASGKVAKAKIVSAMPLGINVNGNNPAMTFLLEVRPEGEPAFQAQSTGVVAEASAPKYQPGLEVYVKYDPADHSRVSLDHS